MELYQLAYFVEVARQRNFTRAAERLRLAQPALSQQIRKLESELGAELFVRGRRETLLTAAGEAFYPRAQALLALSEAAKQTVAEVAQLRRGRLVIATIPTLSACWLPPVIQRFRRAHPHVELILREDTSNGVAELVDQAIAELGFLQLPVSGDQFLVKRLMREPFLALLQGSHSMAGRKSLRLRDLTGEPFVLYRGQVRAVTLASCRTAGFEPRIACESTELETVRALVEAGLGVAVLPRLAMPATSRRLVAVPIREPKLVRELGMITRRDRVWSAAAKAFVATLGQK
jgi:DNA-binding transcriptional LysR family regulator